MGKRIALKDQIYVDGVDISNFVHAVSFTSETERVDVSGFNDNGLSEFLLGTNVREVTLEVWMGRGSNEPHNVLWPLHRDQSEFDFKWLADGGSSISSTNPELRGTCQIASYGEGASRGEAETTTITLIGSDSSDPLTFYAT